MLRIRTLVTAASVAARPSACEGIASSEDLAVGVRRGLAVVIRKGLAEAMDDRWGDRCWVAVVVEP